MYVFLIFKNCFCTNYYQRIYFEFQLCGGVVISERFVITTADCVFGQTHVDIIRFHIKVGTSRKEIGRHLRISKIVIHERYLNNKTEGDKLSHNIALVFVEGDIPDYNTIGLTNRTERVGESGNFAGD